LFLDEMAFVENWDQFESSVMPTISSSKESRVIMVSTPNNLNHFYKYWKDSEEGRNGYANVKVLWNQVPERDEAWRKTTLESMSGNIDKFNQEFCVEFLGSSGTLISGAKLKELVHQTPLLFHQGLAKYADPIKEHLVDDERSLGRQVAAVVAHKYVICVDVSEGKGFDYSAFSVLDVTEMPYRQVCTFRSNMITPIELTQLLFNIGRTYNDALILIEHASLGPQVANSLHMDYEYEGVLMSESAGAIGKRISNGHGKMVDKGVKMTVNVKSHGCSLLKLLVEQNQLIINDFHCIEELSTFIRDGKTFKADDGKNDDTVMALVLFAWLSADQYFKDYTSLNTISGLRDVSTEMVEENLVPFGFLTNEDEEGLVTMEDVARNPDWALQQMFNKPKGEDEQVGKHKWQGDGSWPYLQSGYVPNF
jgi:hypothetical protein